jgi:hypothetical protein
MIDLKTIVVKSIYKMIQLISNLSGGFKHEVQHGLTIDETPLRVF